MQTLKRLNESSSLRGKEYFTFWFRVFVSDVINGEGFWPFWLMLPDSGPNH